MSETIERFAVDYRGDFYPEANGPWVKFTTHYRVVTAERFAREAAEAENARLREDAERYRFLRIRLTGGEAKVILHHRPDETAASAVDVAIDRARTLLTPITRTDGEG